VTAERILQGSEVPPSPASADAGAADVVEPVAAATRADAATEPAPAAVSPSPSRGARYQFLDALRGIAAIVVVGQHSAEFIWPGFLKFSIGTFRFGEFGVILFFLVSGYIIPASLEKYDSVPRFWVGRLFRLFPLYWACVVGALVLALLGRFALPGDFITAPWRWGALNLTMVQQFLGGPLVIGASWSLAYELVFYLGMSILLIVGANRRSVPIAITLLGAAGVVGTYLPARLVTGDQGLPGLLLVFSATLGVMLLVVTHARDRRQALLGGALALVTVPLLLNQPERAWFSLLLFATMAVGTVLYRMTSGKVRPRTAWVVFVGALGVILVVHRVHVAPHIEPLAGAFVTYRPEVLTFAAAYGVFAIGVLLRRHRWPGFMTYLGRISYSLYLVHTLVLYSVPWWSEAAAARIGLPTTWLTFVTWVGVTVAVSALTYRFIELPFQNLGHRLTKRPATTPIAPDVATAATPTSADLAAASSADRTG
jgi:peptidoglycan/LPS O-acetylase OafA/YrhL